MLQNDQVPVFEQLPDSISAPNRFIGVAKANKLPPAEQIRIHIARDYHIAGLPSDQADIIGRIAAKYSQFLFLSPTSIPTPESTDERLYLEGRGTYYQLPEDTTVYVKGTGSKTILYQHDDPGFPYPQATSELFFDSPLANATPRIEGSLYAHVAVLEHINTICLSASWINEQGLSMKDILSGEIPCPLSFGVGLLPTLTRHLQCIYQNYIQEGKPRPQSWAQNQRIPSAGTIGILTPGVDRVPTQEEMLTSIVVPEHLLQYWTQIGSVLTKLIKRQCVYDPASCHNQQIYEKGAFGFADATDLLFFSDVVALYEEVNTQQLPALNSMIIFMTAYCLSEFRLFHTFIPEHVNYDLIALVDKTYMYSLLTDLVPESNREEVAKCMAQLSFFYPEEVYTALAAQMNRRYAQIYHKEQSDIAIRRERLFIKYEQLGYPITARERVDLEVLELSQKFWRNLNRPIISIVTQAINGTPIPEVLSSLFATSELLTICYKLYDALLSHSSSTFCNGRFRSLLLSWSRLPNNLEDYAKAGLVPFPKELEPHRIKYMLEQLAAIQPRT